MKVSLLRRVLLFVPLLLTVCYTSVEGPSPFSTPGRVQEQAAIIAPLAPEKDTNEHPRLFFTSGEIGNLRAKAQGSHQEIWTPIQKYVVSELGTAPPGSTPPNGDLDTFRNHGNQLIPFAFACVITDGTDICDLAKDYLLAYASWQEWTINGERGLALAHMVYGSAIAYDWLYDRLSADERQAVRQSLGNRAQQLYEASISNRVAAWNNFWTDAYVQNIFYIAHSALGFAGLALSGEDDRAQSWIDRASERMSLTQGLLNGIGDGSWHEGMAYQGYALTLSLPFLVNLRNIAGLDLIPHVYLQNYVYWRLYNYLSGTTQSIMAFGDFDWSRSEHRPENVLRFTASEYDNGHAEWLAQQLVTVGGRYDNVWSAPWYIFEFLYYDPQISVHPPTDLPTVRVFPDLEGVIWRTGWQPNDLVFGLKTGAYGGRFAHDTFTHELYPWNPPCPETDCKLSFGHDHDDANGFYLFRNGQWLAPEMLGTDRRETRFHNTLLIDGQGQFRPPNGDQKDNEAMAGMDGYLETVANTPAFNYVAADATRRYKHFQDLRDFTRHVLFVRPHYFLMVDNVAATEAHNYEWISHFGESVTIEEDWIRGNSPGGQVLGIGVLAPESFIAEVGSDGQPFVSLQPATPVASLRFVNLLYPTDTTSWEQKPAINLVADDGQMLLAQIISRDGSRQQDNVLLAYRTPGATITLEGYTFNGRVAVIQQAEGKVKKLFIYGGNVLRDEETEVDWLTSPAGIGALEITYEADTVFINGRLSTNLTLYAPEAEKLLVNGQPWTYTRSGDYITLEAQR